MLANSTTTQNPRPTFLQAATVSALTSVVFLVIYNLSNWLTGLRPDVQTAAFAWERMFPVVEWMIVPYWSLDAFFVVAPFLCSDRAELSLLRRRLVWTNVIAGLCFLIIPLELAWTRPKITEGMFEPWFRAIQAMDAPHNLFPSLHIVLRTLMAVHYAQHSRGVLRVILHVWFSLIGISTLLTWQHHIVDVYGGFLLAAVIFHVLPAGRVERAETNPRLGYAYLAVTVLLLFACRLYMPWTLILAWPAAALGTVAAGYLGIGAAAVGKQNGRHRLMTRLLLLPWLLGQKASWWYYRRQSAPWDALTDRVWMGSVPSAENAQALLKAGVTHVLDLTAEFEEPAALRNLPGYRNLAVADLTAPTQEQLREAAAFIQTGQQTGIVYVHCKAGYSRTAAAVGAWLLEQGRSTEEAMQEMRAVRPGMVIRPEIVTALRRYERGEDAVDAACSLRQVTA